MPHHDAPYGSHPNDVNGTPQPEDVEVPEHIKTIQSLSSATRNPDVAVHFGTMMFKNLKIKLRTPVSCCLETLLPVIFVLGLMFIWLAVTEGTVPNTHYLKVDQPNITTIPVQTAIDKYACIKSGNAAVVGIRSCTSAEEANTTHPLFCYAYPTVPVRGLCTTIDGQSIALQWLDFKMTRFVPSIDEMIFMQWMANATFTYRMKDNGYQQPLGGLANGGKLNFAPDSSTVRNFIAHLNTTSNLFRHSIGRVFSSSDEAASFVSSNDQADRNWGVVVFDKFDASGLDVTIRMNRSGVPWTNQIIEIGNGNGQFRTAQYMTSGFITLQDAVSRYYIQTFTSGPLPAPTVHTPMPFISYDTSAFLVIIGGLASLFLVFGYLYPVSQLVKRIVEEKEQRVREAMMIMGLATGPFYCSWVVTYFIIQFFTALLAAIILKATMFPKSDFFIQFLLYFLFGISNITLSSCMSAFFSKSRIAALVAPVVFFIFSIPSFALPSTTPAGVLIILSLMGPTAFANGMNNLVNQEITGGSTWTNINKSFNDYPISVVFVMLAIDTILYMLLTLYFDAVLPSEWGVRTHPLFCCVNPYRWWKSRQQDKANADEEMKDGRDPTGAFEPTTPGVKPSVELRGLRKEFVLPDGETMVAVNDLTFNMYENQVFALLGHNGAGKTTAMNLMTGMLELDGGDCFFHGYSVRHDIEKVRREIGYCPQHNILWAELTCREHLDFFARLKGLDSDTRPKAVEAMLKAVDLEEKGDKFPHELSGGQKRKLSVGIAFVGGSKVVFLDEPTAGMDVAARRHTWELIKMMTPGRTIVLTTHYMDEADLLGNTIAVMAKGRLKCAGSSLFLKSRLGVGYNLNIAVGHGATNSQQIIDGCRQFVPTLDILANGGGEIGLRLPMESAPQFPNLLSFLEDSSAAFGIRGHGISVTTLEEIFLKIGHDDEHAAEDAKKAKKGSAPSTANSDVAAHSAIVEPDQVAIDVSPTTDPDADKLMWTDEISQAKGTAGGQFSALFAKRFHYAKRDTRTIVMQAILPVVCITFAMLLTLIKFPDAPKFTFGNPANYQGATETVFANCPAGWTDYVSPIMHTDAKVTSTVALDQFLFTNFQKHVDNRIGAYMCNDVNAAPVTPVSSFFTNNTIYRHSAPHTLNEFHGDYIRNMRKEKIDIKFSTHPVPLSNYESAFIDAIVTLFVAIFVLIPFTFVPSTFVSFIVKEREVRALQLQRASGMMYGVYWCANYLFDTCSFVITALLAITIFAIFGRNEYIGDGELFGAIFLLLMLYGCASVAGSYISSFFFDSHSTAQNIVMLVNFICGFMLVLLAYILTIIDSTEEAGKILKYFFRVVPAYCLGEGILNMADRKLKASFGVAPAVFSMEVVGWPMLYLGLEIPIFCLIVIYLDSPLRRAQAHAILDDSADTAAEHIENEDEDVLVERNEIESGSRDTTDLVVVKNLRKFYPSNGGVLAVKNLSFGVHKGEVFGFLGTNGAGKTTTISILCGDQMPSRGQGWIAGCDVVNDAAKARSLIGYCPQFDALHDLLTVEEHLNLYAGLHGLTGQLATDVTERLIRVCDLQEHRVKESRSLSGGNKRKLSVAISLLGAPQVVFLDEPSAGMDPMARRTMWSVIEQIAEHCSVVLTTHHLEEIEALSSRMGIMVDGELKCIGPLQHLKTKFGSGFEMSIRVRPEEKAEAAEAFFHGQLPDAHLQEKRSGKLTYALPQSTKLSVVFKLIEDNKTQFSITDYSVSQTSLETVFLRISADAKNTGD